MSQKTKQNINYNELIVIHKIDPLILKLLECI